MMTVCPICECTYATLLRRPGSQCRDLSHGQTDTCVGRVIPLDEYQQAEWRNDEGGTRIVVTNAERGRLILAAR